MAQALRRCLKRDLDGILEVEKASFAHRYDYLTFLYYLHDPSSRFVVAEEDGEILGYVIYSVRGVQGLLVSIAVRPSCRRRGIGRKLLQHALQELGQRVEEVELQVGVRNRQAIAFYEGSGFEAKGIVHRYYADGEDALVMKKTTSA